MFVSRLLDMSTGETEVDPVAFESVVVNTDDAFNVMDATFTADVDGHYLVGKL